MPLPIVSPAEKLGESLVQIPLLATRTAALPAARDALPTAHKFEKKAVKPECPCRSESSMRIRTAGRAQTGCRTRSTRSTHCSPRGAPGCLFADGRTPRGTLRRIFYQGFYACCIPACLGSLLPSLKNVCAWKRAAKTPSSSASCGQHLLGSVQKNGTFRCSSRSLSRALQPSSGTVVPLLSCPARIPVF